MIRGVFHEPPGVDFSRAVVAGLTARLADAPPEALARVTLLVNTHRMARRVEAAFAQRGATLLPRIGLVSDLAALLPPGAAPRATIAPLALRLRLTRLVERLLAARPDLAPPAAAFDLAGTLATLLAEMQEEGTGLEALEAIETGELSDHWRRNLDFLRIVLPWLDGTGEVTPAAAQRAALDILLGRWRAAPPAIPSSSRAPPPRGPRPAR
ncbi:hypothetical protein [Jannaschia ovalis]|uniref:Double-strand break repair protein AddB n=1 Tax=Jannaschia ovalis TaxID=3038773 RepID=A0ABY8LGL6_9RHOB|nr:hypothetical protein [Jannaschia sp. GRR-S6-38]WGH80442.1 hypothetical protein P8627_10400 [Jannaschia sp. GRR-S6-38]